MWYTSLNENGNKHTVFCHISVPPAPITEAPNTATTRPPVPDTTRPTPSIPHPESHLDGLCRYNSDCIDDFTVCLVGRCRCRDQYFEKNARCGESRDHLYTVKLINFKILTTSSLNIVTLVLHYISPVLQGASIYYNNVYCCISVLLVPLNKACGRFDICKDDNAGCIQDFCECSIGYFEKRGICGKCRLVVYIYMSMSLS